MAAPEHAQLSAMRTQAQCGQRLHGGGLNRASSLRRQPTVATRVAYPRKNPGAVSAQSAITNTLQCKSKHLTTTAINSSVESSPPSPAFAGSLHCRILNRPPGQLVALVHALHRSGLPNGGEKNDLWTKVATFLSSAVKHIVKECTVAATSVLDLGPLAVPA